MRKRLGRRVARFLIWGLVLCFCSLAGGLWFAYWYITDSDTIARVIREYAVQYLPKAILEPGRIRPSLFRGEIVFHDVKLRQAIDGSLFETLRLAFLQLKVNPRKLAEGVFEPREVLVGQPTLRLRARRDGTWNLQGLIADPWPGPWIKTPPITIHNGTVELYPCEDPASNPIRPAPAPAATLTTSNTTHAVSDRAAVKAPVVGGAVDPSPAILRDVTLTIEPIAGDPGSLKFEGSARGDGFERLMLTGSINLKNGDIELSGELRGLLLSENLRRRLPPGLRPTVQALALNVGVIDLEVHRLGYNPAKPQGARFEYNISARIRDGVWECPDLPFFVNDLTADVSIEDRVLKIKHARGSNGNTILDVSGWVALDEFKRGPMNLHVNLDDLELDDRLRNRTPDDYKDLWDLFKPRGRVNIAIDVARKRAGAALEWSARVKCRDIAAEYRHFPYALDHLTGLLTFEKGLLTVDLKSLSGPPLWIAGKIRNPGDGAVVQLEIKAESLAINDAIKKAMPPNVRKVVNEFNASGLVNARASVVRKPVSGPRARPEGDIKIDAEIDLTERCEITWVGLPYPVRNLKGRLEIHPDRWTFKNVTGSNGEAKIWASGSVLVDPRLPKLPGGQDPLKIDVVLQARNLPFTGELQKALPKAWKKTWPRINPSGACNVDAKVHVAPGTPERTEIKITPLPESHLRLLITRSPQPGIDPGGTFELPLDDVSGQFVFYNRVVTMNDVQCSFRGAPVGFASGTVLLEDSGRFNLNVLGLWFEGLRFDLDLRNKMPPLMAQLARKLDGGGSFQARGDLQIGWSGIERELAWCKWQNVRVVFIDNAVRTAIPVEHIQGQLENVSGWSNGMVLEVEGMMDLESVSFMGQQLTQLVSPFHLKNGLTTLDKIHGHFLGGELVGDEPCTISVDVTPRYHAALSLRGAQLEEYARTISGRQSYRGTIDAKVVLDGQGSDVRSIHGGGEAHISQGDLGELPAVLRLASLLNSVPNIATPVSERPRTPGKTAFDSADVSFTVTSGMTRLDRIKFTGNAFSLQGAGTLDTQGSMDLRLNVLWGRDRFHIPLVSDFARRASTPFFIVRIKGTPSNLQRELVSLPPVSEALKSFGRSRSDTQPQ
jgi:AsmA-like C-terminal region